MIIVATRSGAKVLPSAIAAERRAALPPSFMFVSPLAEPAERDVIDLICIADPRTPWPKQLRHTVAPTVALIGDDPGTPDGLGGPDAWRCACKLTGWAKAAIVHGAGGDVAHYREAVRAALLVGRVVLIETTSRHATSWAGRIACPRTLLILPTAGPHPAAYQGTVH